MIYRELLGNRPGQFYYPKYFYQNISTHWEFSPESSHLNHFPPEDLTQKLCCAAFITALQYCYLDAWNWIDCCALLTRSGTHHLLNRLCRCCIGLSNYVPPSWFSIDQFFSSSHLTLPTLHPSENISLLKSANFPASTPCRLPIDTMYSSLVMYCNLSFGRGCMYDLWYVSEACHLAIHCFAARGPISSTLVFSWQIIQCFGLSLLRWSSANSSEGLNSLNLDSMC